jgi:hypothetical protein
MGGRIDPNNRIKRSNYPLSPDIRGFAPDLLGWPPRYLSLIMIMVLIIILRYP